MKNRLIANLFAVFTASLQIAHADLIDLPNLDDLAPPKSGGEQVTNAGSLNINAISRKSGGSSYKVTLSSPSSLQRIDIRVAKQKVKLLSVQVKTDSGLVIKVKNLSNSDVLEAGTTLSSESFNQSERISSIEILAESFGGESDIVLTAVADRGIPKIILQKPVSPVVTQPPPPPPPPVVSPQRPGRYKPPVRQDLAYDRTLREGDGVLVVSRNHSQAVVLGYDSHRKYIIRFTTGTLAGQIGDNWERSSLSVTYGCTESLCAEDIVYNKRKDSAKVRVAAIEYSGKYVLEFLEGPLAGRLGENWELEDLTLPQRVKNCGKSFCVGDMTYLIQEGKDATQTRVAAVDSQGKYSLYFTEGRFMGRVGSNWTDKDLARTQDCGTQFCVGETLYNTKKNYVRVQVLAVQADPQKYVIKFLEGPLAGRNGSDWAGTDLKKFNY